MLGNPIIENWVTWQHPNDPIFLFRAMSYQLSLERRRGLRVAEGAIGISGLAGRYATALFELARDKDEISSTESDLLALGTALESSRDLSRLINSPAIAREQQARAMGVVAEKMSLNTLTKKLPWSIGTQPTAFCAGTNSAIIY